jgi:hypothetical protein
MADQILVSKNQSVQDTLTAAGRMILVISSTVPVAALFVQKHDLIGLYNFFQGNQGAALLGAATGLVSLGFGLYKSFKRGKQVADVAANSKVPSSVADLK